MKYIPLDEQETTINIFRTEDMCEIYTCDSTMITKLDKLVERDPEHVTITKQDEYGRKYTMPKGYVKFRVPMVLSEERKQALAEQARNNFH